MDNSVSIIIVTFNHRRYLDKCIESIKTQDFPHEIIIVDNDSTDGTPEYIEKKYPSIKLIRNKNTGYGAGNNRGAKSANGRYLVFLNPDTVVEKNWLENLILPVIENDSIITTPKILVYDAAKINTCGNINHFTGLTFTRGFLDPPSSHSKNKKVSGVSGACFAIRKDDFLRIGGFDERFFLYNEDSELSWRAHAFQISIEYVPASVIRHDYSLSVSPVKIYYLEKGRYIILKTYFSNLDIFCLFPSLMAAEMLTFGYALKIGRDATLLKMKALYEGILTPRTKTDMIAPKIIENLECGIPTDQLVSTPLEKALVRFCNLVFSWNFWIFKKIRTKTYK